MRRPEEALQRSVVDFLRFCVPPPPIGPWVTHPVNEGKRSKAEAGVAKAMGQTPGTPDLLFCFRGRFIGIELKIGNNTLTHDQEECHNAIRQAGGRTYVARSLDDVVDALRDVGVPIRGRAT